MESISHKLIFEHRFRDHVVIWRKYASGKRITKCEAMELLGCSDVQKRPVS
jgi:hypothetical protein